MGRPNGWVHGVGNDSNRNSHIVVDARDTVRAKIRWDNMAMDNLYIVRPNLGSPLILRPEQLKYFSVTFAYHKPWEMQEGDVPYPSASAIRNDLRRDPPTIVWKDTQFRLDVKAIGRVSRHPHFEANYGEVKHAYTSREQQYYNGFRWQIGVSVGLDNEEIEELKNAIGWPTLLNLRYRTTNHHALYVHETLAASNDFQILHITDTHISQRNDNIPEVLAQVRNKRECELLASQYISFNDNLRAFIKTANERCTAEAGKVVVALTGDIVDYYFDGWWDGKFICGQGEFAPDRRKEATGSAWGYSNVSKFREIILGTGSGGEGLGDTSADPDGRKARGGRDLPGPEAIPDRCSARGSRGRAARWADRSVSYRVPRSVSAGGTISRWRLFRVVGRGG